MPRGIERAQSMLFTSLTFDDEVASFVEKPGADLQGSHGGVAQALAGVLVAAELLAGEMDQAVFLDRPSHPRDVFALAAGVVCHVSVPFHIALSLCLADGFIIS